MPETRSRSQHGRVKRARLETSAGYKSEITLKDERRPQEVKLKPARVEWIRLTILEVYPGAGKDQDTCSPCSRQGSTDSRARSFAVPRGESSVNSKTTIRGNFSAKC